jgi:integrase
MASIRKETRNGRTSWQVLYRDPDGKQRGPRFTHKRDADKFLTSVQHAMLSGSYLDPDRSATTVRELADQFLAGKVNLKPTTLARYESVLAVHILPRWGSTPVAKITHGAIQAWVAGLIASGQSGASVRKSFGVLSAILSLAVRDKRIATNPAKGVDLPRTSARRRRYLTAGQAEQLAEHAGPGRLPVLVLAYCGLRWSELAALRVRSVDLLRRRLTISEAMTEINGGRLVWGTPKSHESRSVPIPRSLVDDLALHLAGKAPDALVFTTPSGTPLRNRNARRSWFDAAAEAIGQDGLTPHELRHTAASLAVSAGANVKAVQRMLGHASAVMTLDVYSDLFDDDLDAVADRLDAVRATAVHDHVAPTLLQAEIVDLASVRQTPTAE